MNLLLQSLPILAALFAGVRALALWRVGSSVPAWFRWVAGSAAWATVLTAIVPLYAFGSLFVELFEAPTTGVVMTIGSLMFLAGIIAKLINDYPEILRW